MEYRQISDNYSVSGQILPDDIAAVKAAGFKSIICNRPDNEQPGQPSADSVKEAAEAAGLEFRYIPVISGQITEENVADQAAALEEPERSGLRLLPLRRALHQPLCADPGDGRVALALSSHERRHVEGLRVRRSSGRLCHRDRRCGRGSRRCGRDRRTARAHGRGRPDGRIRSRNKRRPDRLSGKVFRSHRSQR